jgi:hypothetical protein
MFHVPTVFVIVAGAGADIGMPLGSKLATTIASRLVFEFKHGLFEKGDQKLHDVIVQAAGSMGTTPKPLWAAARDITGGIGWAQAAAALTLCGSIRISIASDSSRNLESA